MKNELLAAVQALTHKILTTYFCHADVEFAISTFAHDISWLGAKDYQQAQGKVNVAAALRMRRQELPSFDLSDSQYHATSLGNDYYLCTGTTSLQSKSGTVSSLYLQQRFTFIFRQTDNRLETVHIHHSFPYGSVKNKNFSSAEIPQEEFQQLKSALLAKNLEYEHQARFLEQLYQTLPCGILQFSTDASHRVVTANSMTWRFYGYESEEAYHKEIITPLQTVKPEDLPWIESILDSLVLDGEPASYQRHCVRKNGESAWINVVMGRIINGNGQEVIQAVFTDITEQVLLEKAQEQERILENRSLRAAIYNAYPLIISVNLTQNTYSCFVEKQTMYPFPKEGHYTDLMQISVANCYPSYQEDFAATFAPDEILRRFTNGEQEIYMELQQKGIDQQYHWISVQMIYVENPFSDDVVSINLIKLLDNQRSEQARQQQLLRDALASAKKANLTKSDFLSRMSHDIRTPINAIIGMSTIGQLKLDERQTVQDCFQNIDSSSNYLLSLINDILDMSKIETDKIELTYQLFDFNLLIDEINRIIYPQATAKPLAYAIHQKGHLEDYYLGDQLRTKQILLNLLSNAVKFTPKGKQICLEIEETSRNNGYAYLQFTVWDTGIGMSEAFMKKMFSPFEQESPGNARDNVGSGLGLAIVYNLVQLMGGTIQVASKKGEGSRFTVTLPFQLAPAQAKKQLAKQTINTSNKSLPQDILQGQRILLVEDNLLNQQIAKTLLETYGAAVDVAQHGLEGVQCFQNQPPETYQAILMDIRMPIMDGLEATRIIRSLEREDAASIPILAMTANAFEEDKKKAYDVNMTGYLIKPLDIHLLIGELKKVLSKS